VVSDGLSLVGGRVGYDAGTSRHDWAPGTLNDHSKHLAAWAANMMRAGGDAVTPVTRLICHRPPTTPRQPHRPPHQSCHLCTSTSARPVIVFIKVVGAITSPKYSGTSSNGRGTKGTENATDNQQGANSMASSLPVPYMESVADMVQSQCNHIPDGIYKAFSVTGRDGVNPSRLASPSSQQNADQL